MTVDYIEIAKAAIDEYQQADIAVKRILAARPDAPPTETADDVLREIMDAAREGRPMPTDAGRRILDAGRASEAAQLERKAFASARNLLQEHRNDALSLGADKGLAVLRPYLQAVLDEARALAPKLAKVRTAQQVLDAGGDVAAAWQRLGDLADEYKAIRAAQFDLTMRRFGADNPPAALTFCGDISNIDECWPDWKLPPGQSVRPTSPPWPHRKDEPLTPVYDREYLRWVVTSNAQPWLPTTEDLTRNYTEQGRAATKRLADLVAPGPDGHRVNPRELETQLAHYRADASVNSTDN